jgi:5-methylcytosine-specific restriction protein A
MNFGKDSFIAAHPLKPIASLAEGVAVTDDVAADFAVLCANCQLMIHRSEDPTNLSLFRANLAPPKT